MGYFGTDLDEEMDPMQDPPEYCLNCGAELPPGEHYKCDICQQIELGLIDKEDAPAGYIDDETE